MKVEKHLGLLLCLAVGLLSPFRVDGGGAAPKFSIIRGGDLPVCRAFLDTLNAMKGNEVPSCNQKEPDAADGFARLHRAQLSTGEIYRIAEPLIGFAEHSDSRYFDKRRASEEAFCARIPQPKMCERVLREKAASQNGARWLETYGKDFFKTSVAWMYEPEIDIDNDGIADPVLMFTRDRCGSENDKGVLEASPTFAFVMDRKYETVDEERTRSVFGHPTMQWPGGSKAEKFRYIGSTLGIFSFANKAYYYTYLTSFADFENQRVGDDSLENTLDVILDEKGMRRSVCEYRGRKSPR
jgi:hypothetical protein